MSASGNKSTGESSSFIAPQQLPFLKDLWGMAMGQMNGASDGTAAIAGAQEQNNPLFGAAGTALTGLMNPQAQIDAQSASLQEGLGQLWSEQLMPAIESNSVLNGGMGGGRQGVAQGVAAGQLGQAYQQGLGDITASANNQALTAAMAVPGLTQATTGDAMAGIGAEWGPLQMLAGILGGPTVLQQGENKSAGFGFGL